MPKLFPVQAMAAVSCTVTIYGLLSNFIITAPYATLGALIIGIGMVYMYIHINETEYIMPDSLAE